MSTQEEYKDRAFGAHYFFNHEANNHGLNLRHRLTDTANTCFMCHFAAVALAQRFDLV